MWLFHLPRLTLVLTVRYPTVKAQQAVYRTYRRNSIHTNSLIYKQTNLWVSFM